MLTLNTNNELICDNKVMTLSEGIFIKKIYGCTIFTNKHTVHNFKYMYMSNAFAMTNIIDIDIDICIDNGQTTWIFITDGAVCMSSEYDIHFKKFVPYVINNVKKVVFASGSDIFYINTRNDLLCYNKNDQLIIFIDDSVNLFLQYESRNCFSSKKARIVYYKNDGNAHIATFKYPDFNIIKQHTMQIIPLKCAKSIAIDVDGRVHTILKSTSIDCDFLTKIDDKFVDYICCDITVCYHNNRHSIVLHTIDNKFVSIDTGLLIAEDCITECRTFGKKVNYY
jgi:DNA-dependent RNA polymerase auxiliary subunit epsilon